jgi:DNA-binding transcriptional LysR family regulator
MDRLDAMALFVRVVEIGSFSAAAKEKGIGQPAVSKQIRALEQRVRTQLLHRGARGLRPTEAGTDYYQRCRAILAQLQEAEGAVTGLQGRLNGALSIHTSVMLGQMYVVPLLLRFQEIHTGLSIKLNVNDLLVDLVEEGVDMAIRGGAVALRDSSLAQRRLGMTRRVTVATPGYLERHGTPATPEDLTRHNCLLHTYLPFGNEWPFDGPEREETVRVSGDFTTNSAHALRAALLAGRGITLGPAWLFYDSLETGELVPVLEDYAPPPIEVSALYPSGRHLSTKVVAFTEFLQKQFHSIPALARGN